MTSIVSQQLKMKGSRFYRSMIQQYTLPSFGLSLSLNIQPKRNLSFQRYRLVTGSKLDASSLCLNSKFNRRSFALLKTVVPSLGDSITEGTIVQWTKQPGESVKVDDVIVVIETDKVSVDIRSTSAGVVSKHLVKAGDTVKVGQEIVEIDSEGKAAAASSETPKQSQPSAPQSGLKPPTASMSSVSVPDAPPAKAPSAKSGPQPPASNASVPDSKPAGKAASSSGSPIITQPSAPGARSERRVPMSRMRSTIASRLKTAQNTAASLTTFNEIDMTNIMALRSKHKDEFTERFGIKLGFMSAFVRSAASALVKIPDVNASIDGNEIVYHDYVDISVAVSTPNGLVVPVLRNVEGMTFAQIEAAIAALGAKARKNQIAIEDMVGGTFTISNGGVYGSLFGTPILNPPQSAILGMHGIFERPVNVNGKVEIRPMMYVALTYDHRMIDGGTAVTFLKDIKNGVEDPARLLLSL